MCHVSVGKVSCDCSLSEHIITPRIADTGQPLSMIRGVEEEASAGIMDWVFLKACVYPWRTLAVGRMRLPLVRLEEILHPVYNFYTSQQTQTCVLQYSHQLLMIQGPLTYPLRLFAQF